jgi:HUS1 checkpoint protein
VSVGSINDTGRNATSLTEADVSLKLNKKGDQPVWAFEIRGRVSRRLTRLAAHRLSLSSSR